MMNSKMTATRIALALACAISLAACSKKNPNSLSAGLNGGGAGSELAAGAAAPGSAEEFQTAIGDRVFFQMDQVTLTAEGKDILRKQASWLNQYADVQVQIEGHADERGTREYNLSLSARRATAVRNFLISEGISANRVSSIAYGKERPASLCDAEECWSQNRRAVTVITGGARTS
ncbi:MAG: peptidoglycan-associated lipoprotein Pal [Phyllobacteriaceae bacterium]|jgi:peptidoglycan-associated lipoprotein|nr:peptidoglycan-associated lipoprotein Pal [Phyllobacteriaceae bacterium]